VQRDAPDANRGRAFAQFETKNQLAWVVGGIIPVIFSPSGQVGFIIVAVVGLAGAVMYYRAGGLSTKSRVLPTRDPELPLRSE
jgi:hypothetical protein